MDLLAVSLVAFAASVAGILALKYRGRGEVESQFIVTGTVLLIFYIVCLCSGACTILNFLFRWVF